jgi:hypothetical protein
MARLSGPHDFGAKRVGLGEKLSVGVREAVSLIGGVALGETVLPIPIELNVAPGALDEMPR